MTLPSDASLSANQAERRTSDATPEADRRTFDAALGNSIEAPLWSLLRAQADDLKARWMAQAGTFLLLDRMGGESGSSAEMDGLVHALLGQFGDDAVSDEAIGHAMRFGSEAFERGVSLHHVMKAVGLLTAMTLYTIESALDQRDHGTMTAVEGLRLARQLQRRESLLSLAVTRGYMQSYAEALRERFRHLRHDLRNPLGTIKSVLTLMDDDTVPMEARANPSFRAMATRNAKALEELISDRLSDAVALLPVAGQDVSLRAIACAVRRELRELAGRRNVEILIEDGGPHGRLDAAGLELLLRGTLQASLHECEPGERLRIEFEQAPGRTVVALSSDSGRQPVLDTAALDRLGTLARQVGATVTASDRLLLSFPFRSSDHGQPTGDRERSVPRESVELGDGEARHDLRGARESHHGQTGAH